MKEITAGPELLQFLAVAHAANTPVLLVGDTGIGKSEMVRAAAETIGIGCVSINLTIIEAVDLSGLPVIRDGVTDYAPPALLPREGRGFLFLDELGRAGAGVLNAALQLLTERALNGYRLPAGYLPIAATNAGDDYHVNELDPALLSRFVQVAVRPSTAAWLAWARNGGDTHTSIIDFVRMQPAVFGTRESNPRAWTIASKYITAAEEMKVDPILIEKALAGIVGDDWSTAFMATYRMADAPLTAEQILESYDHHRAQVRAWVSARRLDIVRASMMYLQHFLEPQVEWERVCSTQPLLNNMRHFTSDLPADYRVLWVQWCAERGYATMRSRRRRK